MVMQYNYDFWWIVAAVVYVVLVVGAIVEPWLYYRRRDAKH